MRLLNPEYRLQQAIAASLAVHFVFALILGTRQFGREVPLVEASPPSFAVELVTRPRSLQRFLPPVEQTKVETVSEDVFLESAEFPLPAQESADTTAGEETIVSAASVAGLSLADEGSENYSGNTVESNAEAVPAINPVQLQRSLNSVVTLHRQQGQSVWQQECWRQQQRERTQDCDDESLVITPLQVSEARAKEIFAAFHRSDVQTAVSRRLGEQSELLANLDDNPEVAGLAAFQLAFIKEQLAYLNGNFNDNYWGFVQQANSNDPQAGFLRHRAEPNCAGGCVFEYTPPGGTRNVTEREEGFRLEIPDVPFFYVPEPETVELSAEDQAGLFPENSE